MAPERVFVGLGANLGDARATVAAALRDLAACHGVAVVAASGVFRTTPVHAAGPDYLNAVVELRTALSPAELLRALQAIEHAHGRQRPYPNAPRTLDLDLLLYGQREVNQPALTLPHPRLHERAFVLVPLLEIAPEIIHPRLGLLRDWQARVAAQGITRLPS